jgi:putative ABC transport system ATP-binding protein
MGQPYWCSEAASYGRDGRRLTRIKAADTRLSALSGMLDQSAAPSVAKGEPLLRTSGLSKTYDMGELKVVALDKVDFSANAGEFIVILGPSGSGKSTFLNLIGGLDTATSGEAWFQDHQLTGAREAALTRYRRDHVGFVFQFYNLVPSLTARENVRLVTEIARDPMRPEEALDMVGLGTRMDHFPAQLSGGEQQRVAIARAIAKRPDLLLCDEPTGALDSKTGVVVLEALTRVNAELGTTTLVITHNVAIRAIADRVVNFADGGIASIKVNAQRMPASSVGW